MWPQIISILSYAIIQVTERYVHMYVFFIFSYKPKYQNKLYHLKPNAITTIN